MGDKVFAVGARGSEGQPAYTFKVSDQNFAFLSDCEGYRPAPYFSSRGMKWIQQTDSSGPLDEDLKYYLTESYRIVSGSLSRRKQVESGIWHP